MASKGKAKGKGKGLEAESLRKSTLQYQGALDNSFVVLVENKARVWRRGRIIDCRLAKDYDITRKKEAASYEYYIHYQKEDHRLDEWVALPRIRLTPELIGEEPRKKKRTNEGEDNEEAHQDAHEEATRPRTIGAVQLGKHRCDTWYYSPYPAHYNNTEVLFLCDCCLSFFQSNEELGRHFLRCGLSHPPGDEIYRDEEEGIAIFEIDGQKSPVFCENLSYLSKLFLDHKTLYWDTTPFLFFVLCELDKENGQYHITGYFSREKESTSGFNLSCILVLPFHQRKGLGKFLIALSYELSLRECKIGTPEVPLSDLGRASYMSWWTQRIVRFMEEHEGPYSISDITKETGIKEADAYECMEKVGLLCYSQGQMVLCSDPQFLKELYRKAGHPGKRLKPELIHYVPFRLRWDNTPSQL